MFAERKKMNKQVLQLTMEFCSLLNTITPTVLPKTTQTTIISGHLIMNYKNMYVYPV